MVLVHLTISSERVLHVFRHVLTSPRNGEIIALCWSSNGHIERAHRREEASNIDTGAKEG